ncbi:alpha/beta fold hydrolase [Ornithinicoccus halotolerans]|uniref:alpha/beta fold hydrolase n=1 Tax=Ornithinicoccus halotolerans TaxID=1748220 RepID=UPI001885D4D7|nr:alpha/beta fold hydrolase [Ornithinicoccus halotolerans]
MGRPRVVLLHGTRMTRAQWAGYDRLLPAAEVVAPDLPGHGARTGEEFTRTSALATVDAAVAAAPRGQPVVLVGHSLGGYLAMLWAARHPQRLAALVLVGASAVPTGPGAALYRWFAALVPRVGPERMARGVNAVMRWLGARGEAAAALPGGEAYAATGAAWQLVMEECRPALLAGLDCPVVLVNGQLDQMRLHARHYARAGRQVRVVTVPRATHLLPLTHREQLAGVLREELARLGAGRQPPPGTAG